MAPAEWTEFRAYSTRGEADVLCRQLQLAGVPSTVESRALESAVEAQYWVMVATRLAHRARWIVAQLPPTEAELDFLATGKLSQDDSAQR